MVRPGSGSRHKLAKPAHTRAAGTPRGSLISLPQDGPQVKGLDGIFGTHRRALPIP